MAWGLVMAPRRHWAALGMIIAAGIAMAPLERGAAAHGAAPDGERPDARAVLFDPAKAMALSQSAIGRRLGDYRFVTARGETFRLSAALGKPLVVNLVYTSCSDACPLTIQALKRAVDVAASAVGAESFAVVTIGFDTRSDTPQRLRDFARAQGIAAGNWRFLSADPATIEGITAELGFLYASNAGGFDHLAQTSLIDAEGRVYRQIYGTNFPPQLLVEPLKQLLFGAETSPASLSGLLDRVKLLCTVYDPSTGRYRFSYAIFIEIIVGGLSLAGIGTLLLRLWLQTRRAPAQGS